MDLFPSLVGSGSESKEAIVLNSCPLARPIFFFSFSVTNQGSLFRCLSDNAWTADTFLLVLKPRSPFPLHFSYPPCCFFSACKLHPGLGCSAIRFKAPTFSSNFISSYQMGK